MPHQLRGKIQIQIVQTDEVERLQLIILPLGRPVSSNRNFLFQSATQSVVQGFFTFTETRFAKTEQNEIRKRLKLQREN
jgi:hypothetical protein